MTRTETLGLSSQQKTYPLSVVIATLGGSVLSGTIAQLNRGTFIPAEILVCIPEEESTRIEDLLFANVRVIKTVCRGQVAQRAVGFQQASYELVLQLDDDILVKATCVQEMVGCLMAFGDVAVCPKFYDAKTGKYHAFMLPAGRGSWFERLMFWVINGSRGYEPGRIGRAGICMGLPEEPGDWLDIGWLPGGCVLHRKKNLVLFDFYPFKGKAFAEDLFHSVLLKQKGIRLMRCGSAACDVDFTPNTALNPVGFVKWYLAYAKALKELVGKIGGSLSCLYLYLFLNMIKHIASKIFIVKAKS